MLLFELINVEQTFQNIGDVLTARIESDESTFQADPKLFISYIADHIDPTRNQKYTLWILKTYIKGGIEKAEDFGRVLEYLTIFDRHKQQMPIKDINQIKTLSDLGQMSLPFAEVETGKEIKKGAEQKFYDSGAAKLVYNSDRIKIVILLSAEASCYFGKNTQWCTAGTKSSNMFNSYAKNGDLYILLDKKANKRYQFYLRRNGGLELRDENDRSVKLHSFLDLYPEILTDMFPKVDDKLGYSIHELSPNQYLLHGESSSVAISKKMLDSIDPSNFIQVKFTMPPNSIRRGLGFIQPFQKGLKLLPKASQNAIYRNLLLWHEGWNDPRSPGRKKYPPPPPDKYGMEYDWEPKVNYIPWQRGGKNLKIKWYEIYATVGLIKHYDSQVLRWSYYVKGKDARGNEYWYAYDQGSSTAGGQGSYRFKEAE